MREMKDSGIEWIGEIPKDWKLCKVNYLFRIGRGRVIAQTELNESGTYPVYSSQTKNNGCLGYIDTFDFDIDQLTWTTDGANAGTVFLRTGKHNCTNVCGTLQLLNNQNDLRYQKYALEYIAYYHKRADTNGYKIMNNEMASIHTIVPSLFEQERIANYLDIKCEKIDKMIAKEQEEIEKLQEYKQSIITETVTRGLNTNVEMKDSGNVILGLIPSNWEAIKLKRIAKQFYRGSGITKEEIVENGETACVRYGEIYTRYDIFFDICLTKTDKNKLSNLQYFSYGDILFALTGELVEEIGKSVVYLGTQECLAGGDIAIMKHNQNPKFLGYALGSDSSIAQKGYGKSKLKVVHTSVSHLGDIMIALPNLEEQSKIVQFLDKKINNINLLIMNKNEIIEKLMSYKKSLIYEVVTGKKEV
ncbi:restriction endonuclease subunit S [Thomasclavelia cocleata]|uniref:restriction endonuclease subunit S n=1 Tax=Thomasclavelia cocleata TaxID=69824 RepID=UPI00242CBA5B|nr:restriction endonuclease subunit S [Thomasclavelia cocleata]MCI9131504.1 restriction endonuclease subunit S [Thomasclavelia cocleata]